MNFNEETLKGKWTEIKGEVQKAWGKLTNDELEKNKGDVKAITGIIAQRYSEDKEQIHKKFSDIIGRFAEKKDKIVDDIKTSLKS